MRRVERPAVAGVMTREVSVFRDFWKATTFSSVVEPTIYLLAFGFGIGALVAKVGGLDYIQYVGTGTVATAVLFASVFTTMFGTFVKREFQRTYDAMLAAPVDTEEVVTAEGLWVACRAGVYGCAPLLVAILFGLPPSPGMLLVPFIAFLTGLGFALLGIFISGVAKSINNFSYVTSAVITPLFLLGGTYFPLSGLPRGVEIAGQVNPLYHCVQLVRHAVIGPLTATDLLHVLALVVFAIVSWLLAVHFLRKRLID